MFLIQPGMFLRGYKGGLALVGNRVGSSQGKTLEPKGHQSSLPRERRESVRWAIFKSNDIKRSIFLSITLFFFISLQLHLFINTYNFDYFHFT